MKKLAILLWILSMPVAFAQSQNFEGIDISFDYNINAIADKSTPGGSVYNRSGVPSITADAYKAIGEQWLVGVYGTYDLGTTDTTGQDPDAKHPIEAGAKLGYALAEKWMPYIKLGYSWSKFSSPGYYQWLNGPSYGLGVDYLITKNLFVRAEVSQQNYKTVYWNDGSSDKVYINSYGASIGWKFQDQASSAPVDSAPGHHLKLTNPCVCAGVFTFGSIKLRLRHTDDGIYKLS